MDVIPPLLSDPLPASDSLLLPALIPHFHHPTHIIHSFCLQNHVPLPNCHSFLCLNLQVRQKSLEFFNQFVSNQEKETQIPPPLWTTSTTTTTTTPKPSPTTSLPSQGTLFILFLVFLSISIFAVLAAFACCCLFASDPFKSCRDCLTCASFVRGVVTASSRLYSCVVPERQEEEEAHLNERELEEMNPERQQQLQHEEAARQLNVLEDQLGGGGSNPPILRPQGADSDSAGTNSTLVEQDETPPPSSDPPPPPPSSSSSHPSTSSSSSPPPSSEEKK